MVPRIKRQETVLFQTEGFPEKVSLDPEERLLETSRINNHSFSFYRVRFGFDWKKQREHLVLLVPGLGNNAFDGNSIGVGIRYRFDNYRLYAIPGYGTKNKRGLYLFNFDREHLGFHGLEAGFSASEYGGVRSQGIRGTYEPPQNPGELEYKFHSSFSREILFSARRNPENSEEMESGESNIFLLQHSGAVNTRNFYQINWDIWNEQPSLELESDFSYVRWQVTLGQILRVGHRKWFELDIIHANTTGVTPLQKKFQLGSPEVLRGYPQQTDLIDDYLLASRLDFKFPLITTPIWGTVSAFKIQGTVFYDQGRIWSENISFKKVPRKDRKYLKEFLNPILEQAISNAATAIADIRNLCPRCFNYITDYPSLCPNCSCKFKSPVVAGYLSLISPGLGNIYLGSKILGFMELIFMIIIWAGLITGIVKEYQRGSNISLFLFVPIMVFIFVLHGIDALKSRYLARKGIFPNEKINYDKDINN